jgi:protocatechuate 3,4-dioxygenase beta subunit
VLDGGGAPLEGICVNIDNGPGAQTDVAGAYAITGLVGGSYLLQFSDCRPSPAFVTQWYLAQPDSSSASSISVLDGVDTPLADVTMEPGVSVTGTVTDGVGNPISGVNVWVNPMTGSGSSAGAQSAADGTYATSPLPSGDYRVQFSDPSVVWATQYWNQQFTWATAQSLSLSVQNGPVASGVDGVLLAAASVSGTVTDDGGQPLPGVCVSANIPRNGGADNVGQVTTAGDGTFTISGLPPTDLRIQYRDCSPTPRYLDQWYGGATDPSSSPAVLVAPGEQRMGIDAVLQGGTSVSGTVTDGHGAPVSGINVNVNPTSSGPSTWAQTAADGTYTTGPLPPGDYRVQFSTPGPSPSWATEFWHQQPSWNTADLLTISPGDPPVHTGVDASLTAAASVTGTVTGPTGQPVAGICVNAIINTPNGLDGLANTSTASDGTYTLGGLPPMDIRVVFEDCNRVGPFARQAWPASRNLDGATVITLAEGGTVAHVDAQLDAAGLISGTVRDVTHAPLEGICVQASTDTFVGGLTRSDSNGEYTLVLDRPGDYHVQFVDCGGSPAWAGQWWSDVGVATRGTIALTAGSARSGIDATLSPGAVGTISGTVRNAHGDAMTSACVVAYLPNQFALFAAVDADGTYTLHDVPSGTFAVAFLGCDHGNPGPVVADPTDANVNYPAVWWSHIPLSLDVSLDGGPDPIAQGANLVTIAPGAQLTGFDQCFGCTPPPPATITITNITTENDSITVAFATSSPRPQTFSEAAPLPVYTLTCSSSTGVTRSASAASSPITVTGVTQGATYTCTVSSSDGSTTVASSVVFSVEVPTVALQPVNSAAPVATLPVTGIDPMSMIEVGLALLALGIAARRWARRSAPVPT